MKQSRMILAMVLVLCMVAGIVVWPESSQMVKAEELTYGDFEYEVLNDGTVAVTKYEGIDTKVTVPEEIDGKCVTEIGGTAFLDCENIIQIILPSGVTVIEMRAFMNCSSLEEIVIPDSVRRIETEAFWGCTNLNKVIIPNEVLGLGFGVFGNCSSLEEIILPDCVRSRGSSLFKGCDGLKKVKLPEGMEAIETQMFQFCTSLRKINIPVSVKSIGSSAFASCDNLTDVYYSGTEEQWNEIEIHTQQNYVLKKDIIHFNSSMPDNDFIEYEDYEYVVLDDGTIEITKYKGSADVVEIPEQIDGKNVTKIGDNAFENNNSLKEVRFPNSVIDIGENSFHNCINLEKIALPDFLKSIERMAFFDCAKLTEVSIPDSVINIENSVFLGCKRLIKVNIPNKLKSIEFQLFSGCENLKEIVIPSNVISIKANAFVNCKSLTEILIPEGLSDIGVGAFLNCIGLKEVSIPISLLQINQAVFNQCSNLTDVYYAGTKEQWSKIEINSEDNDALLNATIHFNEDNTAKDYEYRVLDDNTVEITKYTGSDEIVILPAELEGKRVVSLDGELFNDTVKEITIPSSITRLKDTTFDRCLQLTAIYADNDSESFVSENGVLFNKEKTELIRYPGGKTGDFAIPSGIKKVRSRAFRECKGLTDVTIPDGVEKIESTAFGQCTSITHIELPESVIEIGMNAFLECESLKQINIPGSLKVLETGTFMECKGLTEIVIPEGVTIIGAHVFWGCKNLKSVTIPVSIVRISNHTFGPHMEAFETYIEDVYYRGTKEQWEQIEVPGDWTDINDGMGLYDATIHFKNNPIVLPEEPVQPEVRNPKEELERLKANQSFNLEDFQHYLTTEQMDILERYLFTWLAEVNYAYQYSGSSAVKESVMKRAGIDPQGDFASGMEQAITHVSVKTPFGIKTFEITMGLEKPDSSGNLYPGYSVMHYEVLEKGGIPSGVPKSGQIVRNCYTDMGPFAESVKRSAEDSLHGTYQWENLEDEITAGILVDKNISEIVGNKNGSFSDGTFTVYPEPLFAYSKIVRIACPVDVHYTAWTGQKRAP